MSDSKNILVTSLGGIRYWAIAINRNLDPSFSLYYTTNKINIKNIGITINISPNYKYSNEFSNFLCKLNNKIFLSIFLKNKKYYPETYICNNDNINNILQYIDDDIWFIKNALTYGGNDIHIVQNKTEIIESNYLAYEKKN